MKGTLSTRRLAALPLISLALFGASSAFLSACESTGLKKSAMSKSTNIQSVYTSYHANRQGHTENDELLEGIYVKVEADPMKSADVLFRDLCDQEGNLSKKCRNMTSLGNTKWTLMPFGPTFGEFIFVPNRDDLKVVNEPDVQSLVEFLKEKKRPLRISKTQSGSLEIYAISTARAKARYKRMWESDTMFPVAQMGDRTIDSRDNAWALKLTRALDAQQKHFLQNGREPGVEESGERVKVAVIDTGITDHPEINDVHWGESISYIGGPVLGFVQALADRVGVFEGLFGWSRKFLSIENALDTWGPMMNPNHGTSSVSLVASPPTAGKSVDPLGFSVTGTAYGAEILPAKVSNSVVMITGRNAARGIRWAVDKGAKVISMSIGGIHTKPLYEAVQYAAERGVVIVAAAGTGTEEFTVYPANYTEVVSVSSIDQSCKADDQTSYSNYVDVASPGKNAWFALTLKHPTEDKKVYSVRQAFGTSLSTPHTSGIVAMWIAKHGHQNLVNQVGARNVPYLLKYLLQKSASSNEFNATQDCAGGFHSQEAKYQGKLGGGVIDALGLLDADISGITEEQMDTYRLGDAELKPLGTHLKGQLQDGAKAMQEGLQKKFREFIKNRGKFQD